MCLSREIRLVLVTVCAYLGCMYRMKPGTKSNPTLRWALPDGIFFGFGACHILAGVFLREYPKCGLVPQHIIPRNGQPGTHIFLTDGARAFDFHGFSCRDALLRHHQKGWQQIQGATWRYDVYDIDFDLLDTSTLNANKMLGPDQYFGDAIARARRFILRKGYVP